MWLTPWSVTPALSIDEALYCPSWQRKHVYRVWLQYYKAGQRRVAMELRDNKLKTGTGTFFSKLSSFPELLLPNIATFATIPRQAPFNFQLSVASCLIYHLRAFLSISQLRMGFSLSGGKFIHILQSVLHSSLLHSLPLNLCIYLYNSVALLASDVYFPIYL